MKIFICCSKYLYFKIPEIKEKLEKSGHSIILPNSFEEPLKEEKMKKVGREEHIKWKSNMLRLQDAKVKESDALLILNFEKNGQSNYIGGATFLEIYRAWELGKKVYLMNPIPESMIKDELTAMNPTILDGDLTKIK